MFSTILAAIALSQLTITDDFRTENVHKQNSFLVQCSRNVFQNVRHIDHRFFNQHRTFLRTGGQKL